MSIKTMLKRSIASMPKNEQKGAIGGIPEQVIAIAIGVLMVAGMVALGSRAFSSGKINTEMANIQVVMTNVRSLYSNQPSYGTVAAAAFNKQLTNSNVIPNAMVANAANGTINNAWGQPINIAATGSQFTIQTTNISQEACVQLLVKTPPDGIVQVSAGKASPGTVVAKDTSANGTADGFPVQPGSAQAACNGVGNTNQVTWTVR